MALSTEPRMRFTNGGNGRSLIDLIRELRDEFVTLFKHQITLMQVEMEEKAKTAIRNSIYVLVGGVVATMAAIFLLVAMTAGLYAMLVAGGLSHFIAGWLSPLLIGVVLAGAGWILIAKGLAKLSDINPTPDQTMQSLKEHQDWISEKVR